jgi:selenocysteine-specific elongation factor
MTAKKAKKPKRPDIVHAMIGTAGHVSHGKSTLVEILTGCVVNRLPEEQQRGLTINLGFAACFLPGDRVIGIVDVPGHRDFIRNMVAGAVSIDILMLVVAADDGVMPQTEEHVKIARLLGARRVMVVVTKTDLVDAELVELVKEDVSGLMARSGFADVPIVCFSGKTAEGLDDVRETLEKLIDEVGERHTEREPQMDADGRRLKGNVSGEDGTICVHPRSSAVASASGGKGAFRMDIERAFSVKGHGTVVTGIPASGALAVGDEAELLPPGEPTTVRAVQTYKYSADAAVEGACAAINVRDIPVEAVSRGMTLVAKGAFGATSALLAAVTNASESVKLKRITEIKFHCGTAGVNASLRLIGARSLGPGEEAFAEVRLAEPLVVAAGDRFILRTHSPSNTVGGGTVLSPRSGKLKASSPALHRRLERARDAVRAGDRLASALLAGPSALIETDDLLRLTQARRGDARKIVAEREKKGDVVSLGGDAWLVRARQDEVVAAVKAGLARYHREHKYALGMRPEQTALLLAGVERAAGGAPREDRTPGRRGRHGRTRARQPRDGARRVRGRHEASRPPARRGGRGDRPRQLARAHARVRGLPGEAVGSLRDERERRDVSVQKGDRHEQEPRGRYPRTVRLGGIDPPLREGQNPP